MIALACGLFVGRFLVRISFEAILNHAENRFDQHAHRPRFPSVELIERFHTEPSSAQEARDHG